MDPKLPEITIRPRANCGAILVAMAVLAVGATAPTFAAPYVDPNCNQATIAANADALYQNSLNTYTARAGQPAPLDGCLGSLSGLNMSIGSFDLSSIFNQLVSQACSMATNAVNNVTNGAIGQVNGYVPQPLQGTVGIGSGQGGINVVNGGANNIANPVINGITSGVSSSTNSGLQNILGN